MLVKHVKMVVISMTALVTSCGLLSTAVHANGIAPYKVHMDRIDPKKPIRKSAIMSTVREQFPGRILSIRENREGGKDCHVVKSMGKDGEFRIIHVACEN